MLRGLDGLKGEASTAYTNRPTHDAAHRALSLLGNELKLIYLLRDPVDRMVSHYKHEYVQKLETRDLDTTLRESMEYRNYSRYSWQLEPWCERFPEGNILVVHFEDYMANRKAGLQQVCDFLGLGPVTRTPSVHRNASDGRMVMPNSWLNRVANWRIYSYRLKPMLSNTLRGALRAMVSRKAVLPPMQLAPGLRAELRSFFSTDPLAAQAMARADARKEARST